MIPSGSWDLPTAGYELAWYTQAGIHTDAPDWDTVSVEHPAVGNNLARTETFVGANTLINFALDNGTVATDEYGRIGSDADRTAANETTWACERPPQ